MQFSTPAFPPGYSESETRLSMDLTDWIQARKFLNQLIIHILMILHLFIFNSYTNTNSSYQADSYWRCIREAQVDTGERAPSRISFVDDEGNTFIYSMVRVIQHWPLSILHRPYASLLPCFLMSRIFFILLFSLILNKNRMFP